MINVPKDTFCNYLIQILFLSASKDTGIKVNCAHHSALSAVILLRYFISKG